MDCLFTYMLVDVKVNLGKYTSISPIDPTGVEGSSWKFLGH